MKRIISIILVMSIVEGCEFREIDYSFYDLSKVSVHVKYDNDDERWPMNYEVLFFNESENSSYEHNFLGDTAELFLPAGIYDILIHNNLSANNRFSGSSFEDYVCFTIPSVYNVYNLTKTSVNPIYTSPDILFSGSVKDLEIYKPRSGRRNEVEILIYRNVKQYRMFIPVKGIHYILSISGVITGMASSFSIKDNTAQGPPCSISLEIEAGERDGIEGLWCSFSTFGILEDCEHILYLFDIKKLDGSVQTFEYDVSELLYRSEELVPETLIVDYKEGQSGFVDPSIGVWRDTTQWIELN